MKTSKVQWEALEKKKLMDEFEVSNITKTLPIIKWIEYFAEYTHQKIGAWMASLAYTISHNEIVSAIEAIPDGTPHTVKHIFVKDKLIAHTLHP